MGLFRWLIHRHRPGCLSSSSSHKSPMPSVCCYRSDSKTLRQLSLPSSNPSPSSSVLFELKPAATHRHRSIPPSESGLFGSTPSLTYLRHSDHHHQSLDSHHLCNRYRHQSHPNHPVESSLFGSIPKSLCVI